MANNGSPQWVHKNVFDMCGVAGIEMRSRVGDFTHLLVNCFQTNLVEKHFITGRSVLPFPRNQDC